VCPASCVIASAVYFSLPPPSCAENTKHGVSLLQLNEPMYATPPAPVLYQLVGETTTRWPQAASPVPDLRNASRPGSCVVTSTPYGRKSSATRCQMYWMRSSSAVLNVASPSME